MVRRSQLLRVAGTFAGALFLTIAATDCSSSTPNSNVSIRTGTAYAGSGQVTIKGDDGWFYSVPSDVMWTDPQGSSVEGSRPDCLPAIGQSGRVKFAATQVSLNGVTLRPVVWVYCQGS